MWLWGIFDWFAKNKTAQAIAAGIVVLLVFFGLMKRAEAKGEAKQKTKDAITTIKTVQKIEKASEHDAQVAIKAGESVPHVESADAVPPSIAGRIFRDDAR